MKKPFEVGERVYVYGWVQMHHQPYLPRMGGPATIVYYPDSSRPHVKFDAAANGELNGDQNNYAVDPKQCRRLVKKERRRVWIAPDCDPRFGHAHNGHPYLSFKPEDGWKEFIEVKRK